MDFEELTFRRPRLDFEVRMVEHGSTMNVRAEKVTWIGTRLHW